MNNIHWDMRRMMENKGLILVKTKVNALRERFNIYSLNLHIDIYKMKKLLGKYKKLKTLRFIVWESMWSAY